MPRKKTTTTPEWEVRDRIYILKGGATPVNYILRSRHHLNKPLQYFDGTMNRSLRYASNQTSLFEDEQIGDVTLPAIIFKDGKLIVPKENILLQKLLSIYHPDSGSVFFEFNANEAAKEEVENVEQELEAMNLAKDMSIEDLEAIARVCLTGRVSDMASNEIRRDMLIYARRNPEEFISLTKDENINLRNVAVRAVEMGIIFIGDDQRTVSWNDKKKTKIITVPYGENVYSALAVYFKTDEGLDTLQGISNQL
jgi:hypothetical protein